MSEDKRDELRTLLLELNHEEMQEYFTMCANFREEERTAKIKALKGYLDNKSTGKRSLKNISFVIIDNIGV